MRSPLARVRWVDGSSSDPNCANASSSRYWARSSFNRPATLRMARTWALPPTRETEMPTLMAGLTPGSSDPVALEPFRLAFDVLGGQLEADGTADLTPAVRVPREHEKGLLFEHEKGAVGILAL